MMLPRNRMVGRGRPNQVSHCPTNPENHCPPPCPGMELARVYIAIQKFGPLYDSERAIKAGTVFPELDMPYYSC